MVLSVVEPYPRRPEIARVPDDLYSPDYFAKKQRERIAHMTPDEFEPWDSAKLRYIETKIEPMLDLYRQSDHDWFKSFSRRRGVAMHSSDLIFKLQRLNPHIQVQQQINYENDWGLYIESLGKIRYLSAVPKGFLTEFSFAVVDERDLPVEEKRGWRTILVMCLCKGAITWDQVVAEFGEPEDGFNEARWMEATANIRHGGDEIFERNIANSMER